MSSVASLARPEISRLRNYVVAEKRSQWVKLNANESPWSGIDSEWPLNRYPDSRSRELVRLMAAFLGSSAERVLVTRGSDDAIDLLVRAFCRAGLDKVMVPSPGFAMYAVAAKIQGAEVITLPLLRSRDFRLTSADILGAWQTRCKLVFLCSPNNPTGTIIPRSTVEQVCAALLDKSLVVVDEAYIEFARADSLVDLTKSHPNLVVLRTLSKAHGLAASRVGALVATQEVIDLLDPILPPYPLPAESQRNAVEALSPVFLNRTAARVDRTLGERSRMEEALEGSPLVEKIWPSEANFLLVQTTSADAFMQRCHDQKVLVRDVSGYASLRDCVRVSIGSAEENDALLSALSAQSEFTDAC